MNKFLNFLARWSEECYEGNRKQYETMADIYSTLTSEQSKPETKVK
jgi:hypothetical protein